MNKVQKWSEQIPKPEPPNSNVIYSCTFNPEGTLLFVAISDILVVYNAENGQVITKPTKASKQPINCIAFAKDGRTFATASNDRSCVIWKFTLQAQRKIQPTLRITQSQAILTLCFNPLTHQLFSGGAADFALYTPGKKEIPKQKFRQKIISSAWSADGQTVAFGTIGGIISFRHRNLDQKHEVKLEAPVWCMQWSPITTQHDKSYCLVGCWDQTFYYFDSDGERKQKISEKRISCNPISINFHFSGEYFLMTGTDKKVSLYSRDLGYLTDITTLNDWSWSSKFRPKTQQIAMTTNSGLITVHQLSKKSIFSSYHQLYARRDNFTDVIVENISMNQKLRVKCKELVKVISLFKDKLAVLQSDRLLIYIASEEGLKYSPYRKITRKFDCDGMQILNSHVLFTKENKVQVYNLLGQLQRQWILDDKVTYLKTVGGPAKRQHFLVGLSNGQVLKVFIDNSFPILLYRASSAVVKCDINVTKKKLAVLDLYKNLVGYDLITQTQLFQQVNINSFSWNSDLQDSLAFSSNGIISIKTGSLPPLTQKSQASIIGFEGFQLFVQKNETISVMDVSQSSTLLKYIQKKEYPMAYKLACLGVPQNDMRFLGLQALQNQDFDIAEKCFVKLKDLSFIDLTKKYSQQSKNNKSLNPDLLKADLLAYQGKYQQAASTFVKAGKTNQAIQLFIELKKFDEAQRFIRIGGTSNEQTKEALSNIYLEQAQWAKANGDWKQAGQLYMTSKNYKKAIQVYTKQNYLEGLIEVCRIIERQGNDQLLISCAQLFKKNKEHSYAKQIYLKMGDTKSLMLLHIELEKWQEAFLLGKQHPELLQLAKLPYANYLLRSDKIEDALRGLRKMNKPDMTSHLISSLLKNAVNQKRFIDASRQYWALAVEELKGVNDLKQPNQLQKVKIKRYQQYKQMSQVYYVYNSIAQFVQTPFFTSSDAALYTILSACRFLITKINHYKLPYVNASYIYYSLAKVASKLQGYKSARSCYDKLAHLVVNPKWQQEMELGSLTIRSKPFSDKDTILPTCARCSMANPLISDKNACFNCKHPFIISFMSFEVLPLIEFKPAQGLTHNKVLELVNSQKTIKVGKKGKDNWNQSIGQNQQVLSYELGQNDLNNALKAIINETLQTQQLHTQYIPITLQEQHIKELEPQSFYILDSRKINASARVRYFINIAAEVLLKCCNQCGKFFLLDEYQFEFIQNKRCPFCNGQEKRSGRTKDIFDL